MIAPSIGRTIHVDSYPDDKSLKCRAGIIGDIDAESLYVAVFNVHNNVNPVTNVVIPIDDKWHDPRDCEKET